MLKQQKTGNSQHQYTFKLIYHILSFITIKEKRLNTICQQTKSSQKVFENKIQKLLSLLSVLFLSVLLKVNKKICCDRCSADDRYKLLPVLFLKH